MSMSCVPSSTTNPNLQIPECKNFTLSPKLIKSLHTHLQNRWMTKNHIDKYSKHLLWIISKVWISDGHLPEVMEDILDMTSQISFKVFQELRCQQVTVRFYTPYFHCRICFTWLKAFGCIVSTCETTATMQQATKNQAGNTADPVSYGPHIQEHLRSAMHKNVFENLWMEEPSLMCACMLTLWHYLADLGIKIHCWDKLLEILRTLPHSQTSTPKGSSNCICSLQGTM